MIFYRVIFTFATVSSSITLWRANVSITSWIHLLSHSTEARGDRELNFSIFSLFSQLSFKIGNDYRSQM
jgi:hypothetical protein